MTSEQPRHSLPQTPRVERLLLAAEEIAANLHHGYLGTEHILLALIAEIDGVPARVLNELGIGETVRRRVYEIVTSPSYEQSSTEIHGFDPTRPT